VTGIPPLPLTTAAELVDVDAAARAAARRAAREGPIMRAVLADHGGPVHVAAVAAATGLAVDAAACALQDLSDDDLLVLREETVELAYPFSTAPTSFVARLSDGRGRFICCAIDALGLAPMLGAPVVVTSACHHSGAPLRFAVTPEGPAPEAAPLMVWATRSGGDDERACTGL
jgi:Alkylmercury lyase